MPPLPPQAPNYFVGVPLRRAAVSKWLPTSVAALHPKCRVHHVNDLHITVAFLGKNLPESVISGIKCYLDGIAVQSIPDYYTLTKPVLLPNVANPTACGYEIGMNFDLMCSFLMTHRSHLNRLLDGTNRMDTRPPRPHVTVARPCSPSHVSYDEVCPYILSTWI